MSITLDNVVALVTGASGGIGREICAAMKAAGAIVIATDMSDQPDALTCDAYLQHDVTSPTDWQACADLITQRWGRLDALVHNAGVSIVGKFEETSHDQFHKLNAVNVDGPIIGTQILLDLLKQGGKARAGGASIVNISSVGGLRGAAFNAVYCSSKAAIKMLSKCLGAEFAALGYNIRVNSAHPGGIDTAMLGAIMDRYVELGAAPSREAATAGMVASHPIGRMGRPDELGGGIVYLCSDAASFVTCSELVIDGGFTQI